MLTAYSNKANESSPSSRLRKKAGPLRLLFGQNGSLTGQTVLTLLFVLLMAAPVLAVLGQAFSTTKIAETLASHSTWTAFRNSVILGVLVSVVSALLAYVLAWAMTVTNLARYPLARAACLIPFMGPPYLMSLGWILFMEPGGSFQHFIPWAHPFASHFFSIWGLVAVMSLHLFPIPFVSALEGFQTIKQRHDVIAKVHGAGMVYRWFRIWLPLSVPLVAASSVLVFVKTIGEFGTPLVFGSLVHFPVLTTAIYLHMSNWPISFSAAAQLSTLLLATVFMVWVLNDRYQKNAVPSDIKETPFSRLGAKHWSRYAAMGYLALLGLVSLGIPVGSLLITSLLRIEGDGIHWSNLSLIHYVDVLKPGSGGLAAVGTSVELALAAATLSVVLSVVLAVFAKFHVSRVVKFTEWLGLLPNSIPDVLLVIGLILFWNAPWLPVTPYNTKWILVLGYVVVLFPFSYTYIRGALFRLAPETWEAAQVHQASPWRTARVIVGPLMVPGMISGWIMVFGVTLRDLVVPMLVSPPNTTVISTFIYGQYNQGSLPNAMALAVITLLLTVVVFTAVQRTTSLR
ncbi:iron ABC transporter permease [Alicyclobacillus sp. SO9]|uniref:ABC transporter permease n=1 Tax=Alicyclobacillus sp. SO9 TaxID=2665646 RepID=UPI0018E8B1AE|nr:iron ABC transporter permease [Alicyclobacillus sp. SO9]QQE79293.1 iron ABC transporter permease [Alicyclobacillus sp. SO9]